MGIEQWSPKSKKAIMKFKIRLSVVQAIWNRVPFPNSVLTHNSYVTKYLMNASHKNKIETFAYLLDA